MKLYKKLSAVPFLNKSYTLKFFFVSFLGIHIPLIGLILTVIFSKQKYAPSVLLFFTLLFTLLATVITLFIIKKLMKPIELASKSIDEYRIKRSVPNLPLIYTDEAGKLLKNIQNTINENEDYLNQKQDLIYLLTHDIKNYAAQPRVIAELMLDEECSDSIKEYADLIKTSADNQIAFLDSFIDLLKTSDEIGKADIMPRVISFPDIIMEIQKQLKLSLVEKDIVLKTNISVEKVKLLIDDILLFRVVFNLVHNALKFSYPKSQITITAFIDGKYLKISVKDSGLGFDNTKKEFLFSKFSKMGRMGTSNEKSIGIGLYLCRQIINKFNGKIDAFSEGENKGAIFTVTLNILD